MSLRFGVLGPVQVRRDGRLVPGAPLLGVTRECRFLITGRRVLAALDNVEHVPLAPLDGAAACELLGRLADMRLVEPVAPDRYRVDGLTRLYARE
ncbi:hypothetical protein [Microtetraspora glauca]|uniref:Uncharacterized protein n=1 Tax=Microtetraspora glauca TaxID=1996 RepID=A0ABV3GRW2_MICGL